MVKKFEIDFLEEYTQAALLDELKRIQKIVGERPVTKKDIDKYGKAVWSTYFRKFGSFSNALKAAGLKSSRTTNPKTGDMVRVVIELWTKTLENEGRRPLTSDLKKYGIPYSHDTYRRKFGNWRKVLILAYNSVDKPVDNTTDKIQSNESLVNVESKTARKEISIRKRFLVFKRDSFSCVICKRSGVGVKLEVDHTIPLAKGGLNSLDNLQTLCYECNRGKRTDLEGNADARGTATRELEGRTGRDRQTGQTQARLVRRYRQQTHRERRGLVSNQRL